MKTKTQQLILNAAIRCAFDLIEDMEKNKGNHFIMEFIFDKENDEFTTRLIDVTPNEGSSKKER